METAGGKYTVTEWVRLWSETYSKPSIRERTAYCLELTSGLRKGELVALLWNDLDIQDRTISVSKQYIKDPSGKLTLSRPKTETSVRRVSIPQEAADTIGSVIGQAI